jgi:hypothetical protein
MTARTAASTPCAGEREVVKIFAVKRRSPASSATSVNVPPISMPSLAAGNVVLPSRTDLPFELEDWLMRGLGL